MIQLFKPMVSSDAVQAVSEVLKSGWIGLGPKTAEFEERFAKYIGSQYAVALNSATSALHLALIVAGVEEGDEVLTTSLTFVSTTEAVLYQKAVPVFVDVDDSTLAFDVDKAEAMVTSKTKAMVVVHYGGNPADLDKVYAFAAKHKIKVIEDAAHACGATFHGKRVGSYGLTCFSFHAVKNLPAGDGGMITTNDKAEYDRLIKLRWMGIDRSTYARTPGGYQWEYEVAEVGYKYHMNDINAAMGIAHLDQLDAWNLRRQQIARVYREEVDARFVKLTLGGVSSNHLCVVRVPNRDDVIKQLRAAGIEAGVHYRPNHTYPALAQRSRIGDLAVTDKSYREIMSLPLHLYLTDADVETVCKTLNRILKAGK